MPNLYMLVSGEKREELLETCSKMTEIKAPDLEGVNNNIFKLAAKSSPDFFLKLFVVSLVRENLGFILDQQLGVCRVKLIVDLIKSAEKPIFEEGNISNYCTPLICATH